MRFLVAALSAVLVLAAAPAGAVGFQWATAPDPDDRPLDIGIWYPSDAPVPDHPNTPFRQALAVNGPVSGDRLPLVVISHGNAGSLGSHADVAKALAEAGFVVVAVTHTGNNGRDNSYRPARRLVDRPRHISRALDFMLTGWPGHDRLDPSRIGIFGFSLGGFTALVAIGGTPNLRLAVEHCRQDPDEPACLSGENSNSGTAGAPRPAPSWVHDPRIRAAVIASPGLGFAFDKDALAAVTVPVQLWAAAGDRVVPEATNTALVRQALPVPPEFREVEGAGHYAFVAPCDPAIETLKPQLWATLCVDPPGFDRVAFHRQLDDEAVAFFRAQLPAGR
ncbi:alpha/beta hydrolase family protein [Inquilinus sp.]|jgi:predicted dienelactone hydrolase|uniref:alpha/beta hydrolase family protein n=1 Tax=Inquilinus sp. TaxID=1932117 RepID=UPI003784B283